MAANPNHSEAGFVISQLAAHNVDTPLGMQQWRDWSLTLTSNPLSQEQAKTLIDSLAALVAKPNNAHVALFALNESLARIPEVGEYVKGWTLPNHSGVVALNEALQMREYLGSATLTTDLSSIETLADEYAGGEELPSRLLVLFQLKLVSPAYSTYDSLVDMGLTEENKELLQKFVVRRGKILDMVNQTGIITGAMSNIETNALTQLVFQKVFEVMKRRDFGQFRDRLQKLREHQNHLYDVQFKLLNARLNGADDKTTAQIEHQKKTLQELTVLKNSYYDCLDFFIKKELTEGLKFVNGVMPIHQQMVQICDNSVALIFIGLIKTGKSTIVDTIIGENVAPSRIDPMTAFPVRYVHDPNATEPVMLVPFALQLNKVVRSIKLAIQGSSKEVLMNQLSLVHLKALVEKIDRGLIFKNTYSGAKDVLEASVDIHDIFRLAVQGCFDPSLAFELPLDWNQGLDSFLTVSVKFPDSFGISSSVKLSVIDTPGVDEAGVAKLNLTQVIHNAVEVSHYVAFTVQPRTSESIANARLRTVISRLAATSKTPTLVLATNRDTLKEAPQDLADSAQNIANSLREGDMEYPLKSVFIVSGKRKLIGDKMLNFINKYNRKPELDDEEFVGRKIADDFAFFAARGYTEEQKKEDYEELSMAQVAKECEKLSKASHMKDPLDLMAKTATENSSILSCNKAIEKSLKVSLEVTSYLNEIKVAIEADSSHSQEIAQICEEVHQNISSGVHEVRASLFSKISTFRSSLKRDCQATLDLFKPTVVTLIRDDETWEFKDAKAADDKLEEVIKRTTNAFDDFLDKVLEEKKIELEKLAVDVEKEIDAKIFEQLARIVSKVEPGKEARPALVKPSFNLDKANLGYTNQVINAHQKQAGFKSTFSSLTHFRIPVKKSVYSIDVLAARQEAIDALEAYTKSQVSGASTLVEKYLTKLLNDMFLKAIRQVLQTSEAMREKEKLKDDIDEVKSLLLNLQKQNYALDRLLETVPN